MTDASPHILIVDDHRDIRDALSRYFAENGLKVTLAESAASARRVLAQKEVDLIVLDIMMPGEDGLSLCRSGPCSTHSPKRTRSPVRGRCPGGSSFVRRRTAWIRASSSRGLKGFVT